MSLKVNYLHRERNRHRNLVWYVRRERGKRIRIRSDYGSDEFWAQYRAASEGALPPARQAKTKSLKWAIDRYRESSTWAAFSNATRRQRENIFKQVIKTAGDVPLREITDETIRAGRERRAATPHFANIFFKTMRGLAQHYTRTADRSRLARDAAPLLLKEEQSEHKNSRTLYLVRARARNVAQNHELKK